MARDPICKKCRHDMDGVGGICARDWCRCNCEPAVQSRVLPPAEIDRQLEGGTRLAPGIWIDRDGGLHFSIPELLPVLGLADTPENRVAVSRMMAAELARLAPGATVIEQVEES